VSRAGSPNRDRSLILRLWVEGKTSPRRIAEIGRYANVNSVYKAVQEMRRAGLLGPGVPYTENRLARLVQMWNDGVAPSVIAETLDYRGSEAVSKAVSNLRKNGVSLKTRAHRNERSRSKLCVDMRRSGWSRPDIMAATGLSLQGVKNNLKRAVKRGELPAGNYPFIAPCKVPAHG